jgi:ArsR family transcriptional regulator, lead/cadmium/zinc/bismuth-responsive transcriptional repressor
MTDSDRHIAGVPSCSPGEHSGDPVRQPLVDEAGLERASRLFRAIGEPARLRILSRLAQGEMCVTELAASERESLSTISQRLRVLRSENIIVRRRRGKHINYALADQHVMDLVFNALAHATESPAAVPRRNIELGEMNLERENTP